jgi:hypothetical protein
MMKMADNELFPTIFPNGPPCGSRAKGPRFLSRNIVPAQKVHSKGFPDVAFLSRRFLAFLLPFLSGSTATT